MTCFWFAMEVVAWAGAVVLIAVVWDYFKGQR